ncbi:hypothetical protein [Streptomyces crystallinus]|uniref:LysM peptidoglycan-binding domain-containing protein n=1 Tax=Streptomyces crystallinus TaxID=68191 RepID=A0ABP3RJT4_9ACTN
MHPITRSAAAGRRSLARVLSAVLSLVVLAVVIAGLPLLLTWATPVIWAATRGDLAHLVDRQDTGSLFLLVLVAVAWIGWAQFTFCTAGELIAQVRGRTWHPPRGMGTSQRAAALLIGSILVLLPTSSALASDAQAAPAPTSSLLPGQADQPRGQTADSDQTAPTTTAGAPAAPTYTVRERRPAESLWGIAERELGQGERWREIARLNEGHTMADGTVFRANSFLQPGWQLRMPPATTAPAGVRPQLGDGPAAAPEGAEHIVTVHPGDYLSKIAQQELGDGNKWPKLFEASHDKPQPHGLPTITDPDVIYEGQQVTVPGARPAPPQPPQHTNDNNDNTRGHDTTALPPKTPRPTHTPGDDTPQQAPAPPRTTTPAATPPAPSPAHSRPADHPRNEPKPPSTAPSGRPHPNSSPSGAASSPAAPSPAPAARSDSPLNWHTVLGAGALLAAAITAALALRRTLQRRRRTPGETIAMPAQTSTAEAQLAAAAEPDGAARLDLALRTLAHHLAQQETPAALPALQAARIGPRTLEVLADDLAQEPMAPFVSGTVGWWVLSADANLLDDDAALHVPAPYPALVTLGSTQTGDLLLVNLAHLPALLLDGNPVHITEVCTSLALELAMSPWATDTEVVTVGFGEDLPHLLPTTRITHMRQHAHALRDLGERLLEAHQMPETQHQPYLLLCACPLDEDTAWQFADLIDRATTVPVTLIAPASTAAASFPDAEILNASLSEPQTLDLANTAIIVQRLEHAAYTQITTALKVSEQPPQPAEGPWRHVPDEPDNTPKPKQAAHQGSTAHAPSSPPSPQAAPQASSEVYPALLAASTDPSGVHLLSPTPSPAGPTGPDGTAGPGSPTAQPPTGKPPGGADPARPAGTGAADHPGNAAEQSTSSTTGKDEAQDLHAPEIRVLGPLEVTGVDRTGHGPRIAQLAALLYFKPGRSADALCADLDPLTPWTVSTLNARMRGLRGCLGSDPAGHLYVPRRKTGEDPYQLAPSVRCDWTRFLQLAEHALPLGPSGLADLEKALTLVRGKPFGGRPLPWAEPHQQEMITRIIDVAHAIATYRTPQGPHHDLNAARRAITTGLDVDPTAELLYRDWMRLEAAHGNRTGLHTAITRIQHVNQTLDCSLESETAQLIDELLGEPGPRARKAL